MDRRRILPYASYGAYTQTIGAQGDMLMNKNISDIIVKAATKCKKGLACLTNHECMCKVITSDKDSMVVIKPTYSDPCDYRLDERGRTYCLCPVRNKYYRRYRI